MRSAVRPIGDVGQRGQERALTGERAALDHRHRLVGRPALGDEALGDPRQRAHAHVEDERAREAGERGPVDRRVRLVRVLVAGDERDAAGQLAVRDRDARVGRRGDAGGHARHDLERDAGLVQHQRLLAAAAEHERVAALEPDDRSPGARVLEQQRVRVVLGELRAFALLADVDHLRVRARVREGLGRDQAVVEDHVGVRDQLDGAHGEQPGVAGSRADEMHRAGHRAASASAWRSRSAAPAASIRRASSRPDASGSSPAGTSSSSHCDPSGSPANPRMRAESACTPTGV